ncbi:MAG: polyamine aminopropyltransferase [Thermanaerothrix sp.]|uniref:Polyamine aminopropyltransferase n=1 Tax=Thermanaerothrix solaris TaxID=3058434 RepID=A0ABU3NQ59_9CHLR|nr:polyamine aminopropyltransferase [Thermanaerothrix sp. 4228-RoL]MDT8898973.1 polyamine aminopropyltransferase [Thermanaerothrix sp. 4228-RoL]
MAETWVTEQLHSFYRQSLRVKKVLVDEQTPYQHLQVVEAEFFGKVLILDGIIQLTEYDNAGYHEMITHIPMLAVENPRTVLIVGGGDGGSLQQVLRYPSVERAVVCELDRRVVEVCREHFPAFGDPYRDPRAEVVFQDAFTYLENPPLKFDVIVSDTTDPIGPAEKLFSPDFFRRLAAALNPGGAIAIQSEQMFFDQALIRDIYRFAKTLFRAPAYYYTLVPTYPGGGIGFMYMSDVPWTNGLNKPYPPGQMNYLNPDVHRAAFALPEFFRRVLES